MQWNGWTGSVQRMSCLQQPLGQDGTGVDAKPSRRATKRSQFTDAPGAESERPRSYQCRRGVPELRHNNNAPLETRRSWTYHLQRLRTLLQVAWHTPACADEEVGDQASETRRSCVHGAGRRLQRRHERWVPSFRTSRLPIRDGTWTRR